MKSALRFVIIILIGSFPCLAQGADRVDFASLSEVCAPSVHKDTMAALVSVESSFNPFAIGVVHGRLSRQPKNMSEALDVVRQLEEQGMNYSLGLSQVNKSNLPKYGLNAMKAFDPCKNLIAGSKILSGCYDRAIRTGLDEQRAVRAALSCYYSGNFTTGFKNGYVEAVVSRAGKTANARTIRIIRTGGSAVGGATTKITEKSSPKEARRESDPAFVF